MTVESNYVIAIATLSGWFKPAPVFQPMTSKVKTKRTLYTRFLSRFGPVTVIARNFDWFIALFARVVIGWSNYFFDSHLEDSFYAKDKFELLGRSSQFFNEI